MNDLDPKKLLETIKALETELAEERKMRQALEQGALFGGKSAHDFLRRTAHDVKAPLRQIRQLSQWLHEDSHDQLTGESLKLLNLLEDRASKLDQLCDALHHYAVAKSRPLMLQEIHLDTLVENVCDGIADQHDAIEIEIGRLPTVEADGHLVARLFANLLGNSARYTDTGTTPKIAIAAYPADDEATGVEIKDNASNIPADERDHVFEPYQRLYVHQDLDGAGLGLTECAEICARLGWTIGFDMDCTDGNIIRISFNVADETHA